MTTTNKDIWRHLRNTNQTRDRWLRLIYEMEDYDFFRAMEEISNEQTRVKICEKTSCYDVFADVDGFGDVMLDCFKSLTDAAAWVTKMGFVVDCLIDKCGRRVDFGKAWVAEKMTRGKK